MSRGRLRDERGAGLERLGQPARIRAVHQKAKAEGSGFSDAAWTKGVSTGARFEWTSTIVKNRFTIKMKEATTATLETVKLEKVTCDGGTGTGEISSPTEVANVAITFTGCMNSGTGCASAGQVEGVIAWYPLSGSPGIEKVGIVEGKEVPAKDKLAQELHGPGGGNPAEFSCAGIPYVVRGSFLHPIPANKMVLTAAEAFKQSKGEQKPERFAGGLPDEHILEESKGGNPFNEAGIQATIVTTFEEGIEASSVN